MPQGISALEYFMAFQKLGLPNGFDIEKQEACKLLLTPPFCDSGAAVFFLDEVKKPKQQPCA
jgi:hypothetical protein